MKLCTKCKEEKEETEFSFTNKAKNKRTAWCRICVKEYDKVRQSTIEYRNRKRDLIKIRRKSAQDFIWEILSNSKCIDCGNSNPIVLQFDHRNPNEKLYNISEMTESHSLQTIQLEMDKCEIRCANCHLVKTINQFGYWKSFR